MTTDDAYKSLLHKILSEGETAMPRSQGTLEILGNRITTQICQPIIQFRSTRNLNYAFMAAEAYWILTGSSQVEEVSRYCKRIAEFSDDGRHLQGAYGPRFVSQIKYVVDKLIDDRWTRQAVMTFWERNPRDSRDIPCTVMAQFLIRDGKLHMLVAMRSSDAWLGVPYDIFSFSMMAVYIHSLLKTLGDVDLQLGNLTIFAGSQHIYDRDKLKARDVSGDNTIGIIYTIGQYDYNTPDDLLNDLRHARDYKFNQQRANPSLYIHNYISRAKYD